MYNIGSILYVIDENGTKVFGVSYDAWDKQTITLNTIGLHRGYTGHKMFDELDVINMNQRSLSRSGESNGRLYAPVNDQEAAKNKSRDLIKKDPKYKQKIISEIQRDGKLSFGEAFYWYGYGEGSPIHVDASKLDLGTIPIGKHKIGDRWSVQTAALSGNYKVGVVYGSISVMYLGNNTFKILPDIYDFDIHWKMGWRTLIRNLETIGARYLHGTGVPFKIIFNGLYHNKNE